MFCACELRPTVMLTRCTKRTRLESTWNSCRAQGAQGLGFVCEFVGNIADDPMTKNIQNSTGCNDTIIRERLSGPSISVISNVDYIRRRLQRAVKETGPLNSQDIGRVVEDSLDEEGEEMVADDAKKGSIPVPLVNKVKTDEQKYIEKMKVLDVVDRKEASGTKVIRTRWVVTNEGTPEKTKRLGSMGCTRVRMGGRPRLRALRSNSWTGNGAGCAQLRRGGCKEQGSRCGSR